MSEDRPYAGQTWIDGLFSGPVALTGLEILARDLRTDAREHGITEVPCIELWANETEKARGFFVGDTSSLPGNGWTKLATL